jgi:hypothetical protein
MMAINLTLIYRREIIWFLHVKSFEKHKKKRRFHDDNGVFLCLDFNALHRQD